MVRIRGRGASKALRLGLAFFLVLVCSPIIRGEFRLEDDSIREYRVIYLEPPAKNSVKIQANLENIRSFQNRLHQVEFEGAPAILFEREEVTDKNDHFFWKLYLDPENMGVFRIERKAVSRTGRTLFERWVDYRDPIFNHPQPLCHPYSISTFIMTRELKVGARFDMYLITAEEAAPWHMFINVIALEPVKVPAGEFECFKVQLEPDFEYIMGKWSWAAPLVKQAVPEFTFWMDRPAPHSLIKFTGTFGPAGGSPPQAHVLVRVRPAD